MGPSWCHANSSLRRKSAHGLSLALLSFIFATIGTTEAIMLCTRKTMCSCDTEDGVVDLSPLSTKQPLKTTKNKDEYYWRPCKNFEKEGKTCGSLQYHADGKGWFILGENDEQHTSTMARNGLPVFLMTERTFQRDTEVNCKCGKGSTKLTFVGEKKIGLSTTFTFDLDSCHCCPGGCPGGGDDDEGLSIGSILVIVFFVLIMVYVVAGIGFQVGVRKAQGSERIPNAAFWAALPGLVKDGFKFTFTCGKRTTTYSQI